MREQKIQGGKQREKNMDESWALGLEMGQILSRCIHFHIWFRADWDRNIWIRLDPDLDPDPGTWILQDMDLDPDFEIFPGLDPDIQKKELPKNTTLSKHQGLPRFFELVPTTWPLKQHSLLLYIPFCFTSLKVVHIIKITFFIYYLLLFL